jgi:uncharacterized protein (DUF58 family)
MTATVSMMRQKPVAQVKLNIWPLPVLVALLLVSRFISPYRGWGVLLTGLGGALLVAYLWTRSLARGLNLTREMRFGWAQVGDRLEERFVLENQGWASAPLVELIDHSTMPGYQVGRGTFAAAWETLQWHKQAVCNRRGVFALGPTTLLTGDPFGIFTVRLHCPASMPFVVMPPIVPLPGVEVSPGGRAGEGRPRPNAPERTVSAASVREYVPGDSMRWIHWRTTAHHDSLFVRLFEGTPVGDWWIFLDMDERFHVGEGEDSTEELGVILAASLADRGLRSRRAVGLAMHGEEAAWLPPQRGEGRRWEILRALAEVSRGRRPLADLLAQTGSALEQYVSLVVITPAVSSDWVEELVPLLRRGIIPTVLLLDAGSFGGAGSVSGVTALLSDLEVAHYVITRDLLDRPEARPGQQGREDWRVLPTGRVLSRRRSGDVAWKVLS